MQIASMGEIMIDKAAYLFGLLLCIVGIYSYFTNDYLEYECEELNSIGTRSGTVVQLYKKGGVMNIEADRNYIFWQQHEIIEGDSFKSYIRSINGSMSYKLNLDDLTYWYRLGDVSGQCRKVGLFKSIQNGAFASQDYTNTGWENKTEIIEIIE